MKINDYNQTVNIKVTFLWTKIIQNTVKYCTTLVVDIMQFQ